MQKQLTINEIEVRMKEISREMDRLQSEREALICQAWDKGIQGPNLIDWLRKNS